MGNLEDGNMLDRADFDFNLEWKRKKKRKKRKGRKG
jgi:hypothetical protein